MHQADLYTLLIVVGLLLLLGLVTDSIGRQTKLPRVTLLFIFGFFLGPNALDLLPDVTQNWFSLIANVALLMVGFSLGGKITRSSLRRNGKAVLYISASVVLLTVIVVTGGLTLLGYPFTLAVLLAGIATATDPAATLDGVEETQAKGQFTDTLLGVVSIDDAWALIVFSAILAVVNLVDGQGSAIVLIAQAMWELVGALLLGAALGFPMAYLSSRLPEGKNLMLEVLGIVLLCGGLALYMNVSFLLAAMVLGMVVANFAEHHDRPFHEIEEIEWPFMILFFVLTGASIQIEFLSSLWGLLIAYIVLRILARVIGSYPGALASQAPAPIRKWMGLALLPQAGIAVGMGLIAAAQLPSMADTIIQIVVVATIFFEIIGPIMTRICLTLVGDNRASRSKVKT